MTNSENHDVYRSPTPGMLQAAGRVQDWSIAVLMAVQDLHLERCSTSPQLGPIDDLGYPAAIEAAGLWLRELIESYAVQFVDAPQLAVRLAPQEVAEMIFFDADRWHELAQELHGHQAASVEAMRTGVALSNQRARDRFRAQRRDV